VAKARKKVKATAAFAKNIRSLRQDDQTWEIDFQALPNPLTQSETHYLGFVVCKTDGSLMAQMQADGRPKAADLSSLLAAAMQKPLNGKAHRPRHLHVRGHRQWQKLFSPLEELGIIISVRQELPKVKGAYKRHLEQLRKTRRATMVRPSQKQADVEKLFPAIAKWVRGGGHIEIGDQEGFGFTVRAIDYGGLVFEDDKAETLAEAMAALEHGLTEYFEHEGIE
jgi:hypothetical protein